MDVINQSILKFEWYIYGFFFWNISCHHIILGMPNSFFTVNGAHVDSNINTLGLNSTGQYIVAVDSLGLVHVSSNYGSSFSVTYSPMNTIYNTEGYNTVVASADGRYFFVASGDAGVYVSSDYGQTWVLKTPAGNPRFSSLVTNAAASMLIGCGNDGKIYTSSNRGVSWYSVTPNYSMRLISGTSTDFIVGISTSRYRKVYSSSIASNYITWNLINNTSSFQSVAVSDNGQYIYAKVEASRSPTVLKISLDGGVAWRSVDISGWVYNVNCSSDGETVVLSSAYPNSSGIYSSNNHGTTWTSQIYRSATEDNWYYVNVSRNGLVGGALTYQDEAIFTFSLTPSAPVDATAPYVATKYVQFGAPSFVRFSKTLPLLPVQNKPGTPQIKEFTMRSIFSDNTRVCYKPGSLSYGGVGSVVNGRHKSKHT